MHRSSERMRLVRHGWWTLLVLLLLAQGIATAAEVSKDDIEFRKNVYVGKGNAQLPYRLFVPLDYGAGRKYPLLLWLHGTDGRGSDNVKQLTKTDQLGTHFWITDNVQLKAAMFVMIPQCPTGQNWSEPEFNQPSQWLLMTMEALAKVEKSYSIDLDRVYVAGQSMGGLGVWSLLQNYRGTWAAAIIMSAYDTFSDIPAIVDVPVWVFQGDEDDSVPVTMVRSMMAQLKKAHANLRYTEYRKTGHAVWNRAFAEPELFEWLAAQQRKSAPSGQVGSGAAAPSR